ncbi:MAG: tyrosine-type recombinase/integrase [Bifidobacteriaceae bacterium]|jgi:integrase|nr:tyrosine-type recombinase/integrase [Bifidobacteriaceae bacterium]
MLSSTCAGEVAGAITETMRSEGYAESTVRLASRCLARLVESCGASGGVYTPQVGAAFASDTTDPRTGRPSEQRRKLRGRLVRLADSYVETGRVDLSVRRRPGPQPASEAGRRVLAGWEAWTRAEGWAAESVAQHMSYARRFLLHLEQGPGGDVGQAPPGAAEDFLVSLRATCAPSSMRTVKNVLAAFARFAGRDDLADGFAQARTERKRSPLPVLSDAEVEAIAAACGRAPVRDAAITLLALTTGLRAVDICAMELGQVDWRAGRISLVQSKTGNPLTIPLPAAAGNAITRYLLEERPAVPDRRVFVRSLAPYTALSGHSSIRRAIKEVLDDAGVSPAQAGTRLTRHSLASRMLAARVAHPTIAAVLGHADPGSVDVYLETDRESMRECVLPLPEAARP